jgi:hypothetical protein
LSGPELKVMLYIIRRTLGFKKQVDAISLNQFHHGIKTKDRKVLDKGCGLKSRSHIIRTLASLEATGYIEKIPREDEQGDSAVSLYRIRFKAVVPTEYQVVPDRYHPSTSQVLPGGTSQVPGVVPDRYPQETVIQETVITRDSKQDSNSVAIANATHSPNGHTSEFPRVTNQPIEPIGEVIGSIFTEFTKNAKVEQLPSAPPCMVSQTASVLSDSVSVSGRSTSNHALQNNHAEYPTTPRSSRSKHNKNPLTLQGQHIFDVFQDFKKRKWTPGKDTIEAANALSLIVASDEEFLEVVQAAEDDPFLNEKGIARDLDFIYRKYEKYRDLVERKKKVKQNGHSVPAPPAPSNGIRNFTQERKQREAALRLANSKGGN